MCKKNKICFIKSKRNEYNWNIKVFLFQSMGLPKEQYMLAILNLITIFEEYQYFLGWRVVYDGTGRCQTVKMTNFFTRRAITINISCRAMCKLTTQPKTSTSFSTINFTVYTLWQPITTFNDHAKNEHQVQSMNTFIAFRSKLWQTGVSST